jgi:hypothetical protein
MAGYPWLEAMAREEAWFDPFGDDHAIPGLWQRERIVFPWKSVEGQGDRHFAVGGQQVAKLQKNVQALHDMENSGSEGGSIFDGITKSATTDEEGYFEFRMELPQPIRGHNPWQKIRLELVDKVVKNQKPPVVYAMCLFPRRMWNSESFPISMIPLCPRVPQGCGKC